MKSASHHSFFPFAVVQLGKKGGKKGKKLWVQYSVTINNLLR